MAINYKKLTKTVGLAVILDGHKVGEIVPENEGFRLTGWRYFSSGQKTGGELFPTVEAVKHSLEEDGTLDDVDEIANIAKRYLNIETLETRNSDSLDFHDLSVWSLKAALEAAYLAGKKSNA